MDLRFLTTPTIHVCVRPCVYVLHNQPNPTIHTGNGARDGRSQSGKTPWLRRWRVRVAALGARLLVACTLLACGAGH
jgi:hypothetical protein